MNWDHLKVFLAVARQGTALAAARELGVNHSTVLRRIDQLEADVGLRLFDRLQSGYRLTADGHAVLDSAEQMETGAIALGRTLRGQAQRPTGTLRLSLPETALLDLSHLLRAFIEVQPDIDLLIENSLDASKLHRLEADIALRLTDTPPELLVGRQLGRVEFAVYGHVDYLSQLPARPTPEQCRWLLWRGSHSATLPTVHHPDVLLSQRIGPARVAMRSNSMEDVLAGICAGSGVGLLSRPVGEVHPSLVALPFQSILQDLGVASVGLWLLVHRDLKESAVVRAFIDHVVEQLLDDKALAVS